MVCLKRYNYCSKFCGTLWTLISGWFFWRHAGVYRLTLQILLKTDGISVLNFKLIGQRVLSRYSIKSSLQFGVLPGQRMGYHWINTHIYGLNCSECLCCFWNSVAFCMHLPLFYLAECSILETTLNGFHSLRYSYFISEAFRGLWN